MSVLTAPPRSAPGVDVRCALPLRLDVSTVEAVRRMLTIALESMDAESGDLVLDCSALEVMDASGLGLIVGFHRRTHAAGRRLVLVDPGPRVLRLLAVTRLHRVLHLERDAVPA
jgi:anti-sigma B factor antagonist